MNNTINQFDLISIYNILHTIAVNTHSSQMNMDVGQERPYSGT